MSTLLSLECTYCGHKWRKLVSGPFSYRCMICGDTSPKVKDVKKDIIDTYAGSPPFPEKEMKLSCLPVSQEVKEKDDEIEILLPQDWEIL